MIIYVLNRSEEVIGTLTNEDLDNPNLLGASQVKRLNGMNTLHLTVGKNSNFIQEENYVLFKDKKEDWKCYIIREIVETHSEEFTKEVMCEDASQELIDFIADFDMGGSEQLPSVILADLLRGTRWSVGTVNNPVILTPIGSMDLYASVLECIHKLVSHYALEVRFRYDVSGNRIIKRSVDLLESIGVDRGKRFEYSKDIESIERLVNSTEIKTALIGIGGTLEIDKDKPEAEQRRLDITDTVWVSEDGLAKTEKGKNYVEVESATALWGYANEEGTLMPRMGRYENNNFSADPEHFCEHIYDVLQKYKDPKITYKINALDLFAITGDEDYAHEGVDLGDKVRIIDKEFNPPIMIENKVIEVNENLLQGDEYSIVLGDKIQSLADSNIVGLDKQLEDAVNNLIQNNKFTALEELEQKVENVSKDIVEDRESLNYNWIKNSDFSNNDKYYHMPIGGNVELIDNIAYFLRGARLNNSEYLLQIVQGGESLTNETVTHSAFVRGAGQLLLRYKVVYKNKDDVETTNTITSKLITITPSWKRVAHTTVLTQLEDLKEFIRLEVHVELLYGTANVTGMMLNVGSNAAKYIKNPFDKIGQGVWDEVSDIISDNFNNGTGYMYIEEGDGVWVYDKPINQNPTRVTVMKGGQLGIGKWDNNEGKWRVTTFIDGDSVNASCINAGEFNGDLIKAESISAKHLEVNIQQIIENAVSTEYIETSFEIMNGAIASAISKSDSALSQSSEAIQTAEDFTFKFTNSGGYNNVKNGQFKALFRNYGEINHWGFDGIDTGVSIITYGDNCLAGRNTYQARASDSSTGYYGISQKVTLKKGTTYTASGYGASLRANYYVNLQRANGDFLLVHQLSGSAIGGSNDYNWDKWHFTFTTDDLDSDYWFRLAITDCSTDGYAWFTDIQIVEGTVPTKYTGHPDEVYSGSTRIDANGVTIYDGALTVLNKNNKIVLQGDSNGDLTFTGTIKNTVGTFGTEISKGGIAVKVSDEYVGGIIGLRFDSDNSINGVSLYNSLDGDFVDISKPNGTGYSPLVRVITKSSAFFNNFVGVKFFSTTEFNENIDINTGKLLSFKASGTTVKHRIYGTSTKQLGVSGVDGVFLGYRDAANDTDSILFRARKTLDTSDCRMTMYDSLNANWHNIKNIGNISSSIDPIAIRISNLNAYLDSGWYSYSDGTVGTPDGQNYGMMLNVRWASGSGDFYQIVVGYNGRLFTRVYHKDTGFTAWNEK